MQKESEKGKGKRREKNDRTYYLRFLIQECVFLVKKRKKKFPSTKKVARLLLGEAKEREGEREGGIFSLNCWKSNGCPQVNIKYRPIELSGNTNFSLGFMLMLIYAKFI